MTHLSPHERETLTTDDREMLDGYLQRIPSEAEPVFGAMLLSTRAIIKHDIAGIRAAIDGYAELLDASDERSRELVEAARQLQAATRTVMDMQAQNERRLTTVEGEREQFLQFMDKSSQDRAGIRDEIRNLRRWMIALTPMIVAIFLRIVYVVIWGS